MRSPKAGESAAAPTHEYALVGLVRKAQGVRGEVLIEPLTDSPDVVFASGSRVFAGNAKGELSDARAILTIEGARPHKGGLLVQFEEIGDRNTAELWRGRYLLAPFDELPKPETGEVYLHDLLGMAVEDSKGTPIGSVTTYYELPQGIMLDVETGKGSVLVPYHPQSVSHADLERRTIVVDESSGLFD